MLYRVQITRLDLRDSDNPLNLNHTEVDLRVWHLLLMFGSWEEGMFYQVRIVQMSSHDHTEKTKCFKTFITCTAMSLLPLSQIRLTCDISLPDNATGNIWDAVFLATMVESLSSLWKWIKVIFSRRPLHKILKIGFCTAIHVIFFYMKNRFFD